VDRINKSADTFLNRWPGEASTISPSTQSSHPQAAVGLPATKQDQCVNAMTATTTIQQIEMVRIISIY
jgi:hypothetical protein